MNQNRAESVTLGIQIIHIWIKRDPPHFLAKKGVAFFLEHCQAVFGFLPVSSLYDASTLNVGKLFFSLFEIGH